MRWFVPISLHIDLRCRVVWYIPGDGGNNSHTVVADPRVVLDNIVQAAVAVHVPVA